MKSYSLVQIPNFRVKEDYDIQQGIQHKSSGQLELTCAQNLWILTDVGSMMLQSGHFIIPLNHNFLIITFKCGAEIMRYVMISGNITMIFSNPGMIFSVNGVILCTFAYPGDCPILENIRAFKY